MAPTLLDLPVGITCWWRCANTRSEALLMIREGMGHHTERLDLADMEAWLTEHHPEVFTTGDDGQRTLVLESLEPAVLGPCLAHARSKWRERHPRPQLAGYELGHLVDGDHPYMKYAATLTGGKPAGEAPD